MMKWRKSCKMDMLKNDLTLYTSIPSRDHHVTILPEAKKARIKKELRIENNIYASYRFEPRIELVSKENRSQLGA